MKKLLMIIFIVSSLNILVGCSKSKEKNKPEIKTEQTNQSNTEKKKYWLNTSSNVIHNRTCKWYGNTKDGVYTDYCEGKNCGICGGCK